MLIICILSVAVFMLHWQYWKVGKEIIWLISLKYLLSGLVKSFANLCSKKCPTLEGVILPAITWPSCRLRRCSKSLARPPTLAGLELQSLPALSYFWCLRSAHSPAAASLCGALWSFALICTSLSSAKDLLGTPMQTSRNSSLWFSALWYYSLHIPDL